MTTAHTGREGGEHEHVESIIIMGMVVMEMLVIAPKKEGILSWRSLWWTSAPFWSFALRKFPPLPWKCASGLEKLEMDFSSILVFLPVFFTVGPVEVSTCFLPDSHHHGQSFWPLHKAEKVTRTAWVGRLPCRCSNTPTSDLMFHDPNGDDVDSKLLEIRLNSSQNNGQAVFI